MQAQPGLQATQLQQQLTDAQRSVTIVCDSVMHNAYNVQVHAVRGTASVVLIARYFTSYSNTHLLLAAHAKSFATSQNAWSPRSDHGVLTRWAF